VIYEYLNAVSGDDAAEIDLSSDIGKFLKMKKIPRFSLKSQD